MDIDKKIEELSKEDKVKFKETLNCVSGDRGWMITHGLSSASEREVKLRLYQQMFEGNYGLPL